MDCVEKASPLNSLCWKLRDLAGWWVAARRRSLPRVWILCCIWQETPLCIWHRHSCARSKQTRATASFHSHCLSAPPTEGKSENCGHAKFLEWLFKCIFIQPINNAWHFLRAILFMIVSVCSSSDTVIVMFAKTGRSCPNEEQTRNETRGSL